MGNNRIKLGVFGLLLRQVSAIRENEVVSEMLLREASYLRVLKTYKLVERNFFDLTSQIGANL